MKMTKEHYEHMKAAISTLDKESILATAKTVTNYKDLNERMRWYMANQAGLLRFTCDVLYKYLNDDHIDTALKSIMKELDYNFVGGKGNG